MVGTVEGAPTQVPNGPISDCVWRIVIGADIINGSLAGLKAALADQFLKRAPG
jgi:hypothetical protein